MRLLITGGLGYLGGRLAQALSKQTNYEIFLGSRRIVESPTWLPSANIVQTSWDMPTSLDKLTYGIDSIVHLAGMNAQDSSANPVAALDMNGLATARLLHSAIRQGVKRFVYLSTVHVYGSPLSGVVTEEMCPSSLHPYASSHRAGEDVVREAHNRGEIEGVVIRLSNSFGAPAHQSVNCWTLLVNDLCRQIVTSKKMVLHSSGQQTRDFITLSDACRAIQHLLELPVDKLDDGLFNVGGMFTTTILEFAMILQAHASKKFTDGIPVLHLSEEIDEISPHFKLCTDKLSQTGFELTSNQDFEIDSLLDFCINSFKK